MKKQDLYNEENKLVPEISDNLEYNIKLLQEIFSNCDDVVMKDFRIDRDDGEHRIYVVYIDGLCDADGLAETVIKPLTYEWSVGVSEAPCKDFFDEILGFEVQTADIKAEPDMDKAVLAVLKGDTAVFVDGSRRALVVSTKKLPLRSIGENDIEPGLRGPRDEFNEGFRQSTALIRRRIRDPKLKLKQGNLGQRSRTDYGIIYLEGVADEELVREVERSIENYDVDAIFDSGMAEQLMEGDWNSPFPKFQATTRPDKVASGIVEGRVAVVFDNSPEVILAPANFNMLLQASDDYYNRWTVGTFSRIIRYVALFAAVGMPGLYIALTVHHSGLLPTKLLFAIVNARYAVTFSVITEVLIMELFFELLREAGIRLPGPLGNTIGVVGGLIVGQAAVDAGIVSTIVVIVVALTAIASFAIPNEVFASVFRLLKFFIIFTSSLWGLYGFWLGLMVIVIHLSGLNSFGQPYMLPGAEKSELGNDLDYVVKAPIDTMVKRPRWANGENKVRLRRR
jgi:spore germination protein